MIGLSRKKRQNCTNGPVIFQKKAYAEKEGQILNWMLPKDVVEKALHGELINAEQVPHDPLGLSLGLLDENVNWRLVERYFEKGAWVKMINLMSHLKSDPKWTCSTCQEDLVPLLASGVLYDTIKSVLT